MQPSYRWKQFLTAGSRTAQEFSRAWSTLQQESQECCTFLGKQLEGELAASTESVGLDRTDGSTRSLIVEQRSLTVFQNFNKLSGAWLLALPGPDTGLSAKVFTEAMAAHLCLPSPAVVTGGSVAKNTVRGGAVIDQFGNAVVNCKHFPGDTLTLVSWSLCTNV